ncbi:MAG: hypothetical protein ACRENF_03985 [Thermodesulfobacteriota bacterium]
MFRKNFISTICAIGWILVLDFGSAAQPPTQAEAAKMDKEVDYYAPIRYVIVYNAIYYNNSETGMLNIASLDDEEYRRAEKSPGAERRMSILMLPNQFNKKNLIEVFKLISKRFPTPVRLEINVHTSLATIRNT